MKHLLMGVIFFLISQPTNLFAADIYGTVRPVYSETRIEVTCDSRTVVGLADRNSGAYRLFTPYSGRCTLRVFAENLKSNEVEVYLSGKPLRYDISLRINQGRLMLESR